MICELVLVRIELFDAVQCLLEYPVGRQVSPIGGATGRGFLRVLPGTQLRDQPGRLEGRTVPLATGEAKIKSYDDMETQAFCNLIYRCCK